MRRVGDARLYALKRLINVNRTGRFEREMRLTRALHERFGRIFPEVVAVDVDNDGRPYYVMPWLAGSLQEAVDDRRYAREIASGVARLIELAAAIEILHNEGLAHRDLKPANVLLDDDILVLADLGLAMEVLDPEQARLTATDEAVGSRYYMAPENENGIAESVDQRPADFYAFGKIAWVLLAGRRPMAREAQTERGNRLQDLGDDRLSAIDALCSQLLERDPRARLADWNTARAELTTVLGRLKGRPVSDTAPLVPIDAAVAAGRAFKNSRTAYEIEQNAARATERSSRFGELRDLPFSSAHELGPQAAALSEELQPYFQVTAGSRSHPHLAQVLDLLRQVGCDVEGLPASIDPLATASGCVVEHGIDALRGIAGSSVRVQGYLLLSGEEVWTLRVPVLFNAGSVALMRELVERFASLEGPFRFGLSRAEAAASGWVTRFAAKAWKSPRSMCATSTTAAT